MSKPLTIDDIDDELDQELNINQDLEAEHEDDPGSQGKSGYEELDQEVEDEQEEDEGDEDAGDADDLEDQDQVEDITPVKEKHTKDEQKEYSHKLLREENAKLKQQQEQLAQEAQFLEELAQQNGYTDVEQFKADLREAQLAKEAKERGIDPVLYKETADLKREVELLKKEQKQQEVYAKAARFTSAVSQAIDEYDLGDDGRQEIFSRLEAEGYTAELILQLPNPKIVIDGVLADVIKKNSVQTQIKKLEKQSKVAGERHDDSGIETKMTLDDLLDEEMKEYKKDNFY
jgi:hypothetical protein